MNFNYSQIKTRISIYRESFFGTRGITYIRFLNYKFTVRQIRKTRQIGLPITIYLLVKNPQYWGDFSGFAKLVANSNFKLEVIYFGKEDSLSQLRQTLTSLEKGSCHSLALTLGIDDFGRIIKRKKIIRNKSIVFYESTDMKIGNHSWSIGAISRRNLLMYIPYNVKVMNIPSAHYDAPIHYRSFLVFAETLWHKSQFDSHCRTGGSNVTWIGNYKLESRAVNPRGLRQRPANSNRVMIAPHWTVAGKKIRIGTFETYYQSLLNLPELFPNMEFIFRPHPEWSDAVVEIGLFNLEELDKYLDFWKSHPRCLYLPNATLSEVGNLSALVTDSGSFLAEYLQSEVPIYMLHSHFDFNDFGKAIAKSHYSKSDYPKISDFLTDVLLNRNDTKIQTRKNVTRTYIHLYQGKTFSENLNVRLSLLIGG